MFSFCCSQYNAHVDLLNDLLPLWKNDDRYPNLNRARVERRRSGRDPFRFWTTDGWSTLRPQPHPPLHHSDAVAHPYHLRVIGDGGWRSLSRGACHTRFSCSATSQTMLRNVEEHSVDKMEHICFACKPTTVRVKIFPIRQQTPPRLMRSAAPVQNLIYALTPSSPKS